MNPLTIDRVSPGDPITARCWNVLAEAAEAAQIVLGSGSNIEGSFQAGGTHLRALILKTIFAKLTSQSGDSFAWTEQIGDPANPGDWKDGFYSGTIANNPATNTVSGVVIDLSDEPFVVELTLGVDKMWMFTFGECSSD